MTELETKFAAAFRNWFNSAGVDFWSESGASEELATVAIEVMLSTIAMNIVKQELLPKLQIAAKALAALELVSLPQYAKVATDALDFINTP